MNNKQRFPVGTKFNTRSMSPRLCTVVDFHVTTNLAGEVVRARYVSTHEFMGQLITTIDITDTAVARGLVEA